MKVIKINQKIFVGDAVKKRRFNPSFSQKPASKINSSNFEIWSNSSIRKTKYATRRDDKEVVDNKFPCP